MDTAVILNTYFWHPHGRDRSLIHIISGIFYITTLMYQRE